MQNAQNHTDENFENLQNSNEYYNSYENLEDEQSKYTDDDASTVITGATNSIKEKFNFFNDIKNNVNDMIDVITDTEASAKFNINVSSKYYSGSVTVIDLSWYAPYKEFGDTVICIFCYLAFLWNIFIKLPDIISGAGASSYAGNQLQEITTFKTTGFGRSAKRSDLNG